MNLCCEVWEKVAWKPLLTPKFSKEQGTLLFYGQCKRFQAENSSVETILEYSVLWTGSIRIKCGMHLLLDFTLFFSPRTTITFRSIERKLKDARQPSFFYPIIHRAPSQWTQC